MASKAALRTRTKKTVSGLLLAAVASIGLTVIPVAPALADGCSTGQASFGCGAGATTPPGGSGTGSTPSTPPPSSGGGSGGGGGGGGGDTYTDISTIRLVPDPNNSCAVRDDGKAALGADYNYRTDYYESYAGSPPDNSWTLNYTTPNGVYVYSKVVRDSVSCLYPPRTYMTTAQCIISSSASIDLLRSATFSGDRPIKTATASSGYAQGSYDYNACVNSRASVDPRVALTEYGYYTARAVSQAQTALVEVAYTPDDVTGVIPAPKIVSLSPVYNLTPVSTSGSLQCFRPFYSPGDINANFTETPCSNQNDKSGGASYVCQQDQPLYDQTPWDTRETLAPFPAWNTIEGKRDGNPQHLRFHQKPVGDAITVNSYGTFFKRDASSTPWNDAEGPQGNQFALNTRKTAINGPNILNTPSGTQSAFMPGQVNDVWATSINAGIGGYPTKLTQVLQWSGTRTITSVEITSIDVLSGTWTYTPIQLQVPTTGQCEQTVSIDYTRAVGDVITGP